MFKKFSVRVSAHVMLVAISLLAAFFRLYRLDLLPPGFQFDQAFYVFDAIRLLQGEFYLFFATPGGTEPLYPYLAMPAVAMFGDQAFGLRLTGAMLGILTIPVIYWCARTIFTSADTELRHDAERIGLLAALFAAISLWHIFFNRYGERVTLLALLIVLAFQFFWRSLATFHRRDFILSGLFTALALSTYPGSRVLPFALILVTGYMLIQHRQRAVQYLKGLLFTFGAMLVFFAPLGIYFIQHPDQFAAHSFEVSIFYPHGNVSDNIVAALMSNVLRILAMFFIMGDGGVLRNTLPARPIFDPFLGAIFFSGVIVWLVALFRPRGSELDRRRAVLLAAWLGVILGISLITDDAPNFARTLPAMPPIMILAAWGALKIWNRFRSRLMRYALSGVIAIAILSSAALSYRDYFVAFANSPDTYYTFDTDKVELAEWIKRNSATNHIYIAPLLAQNGTIALMTRNVSVKSFESRDTIIFPSRTFGHDAIYIFPWEQNNKVRTISDRLGVLGHRQELVGSNGGALAMFYRVLVQNLPDPNDPLAILSRAGAFAKPQIRTRATWADTLELLGYTIGAADAPKRNLEITLYLRALKTMTEDYTFSIKARDEKQRAWGQEDKWLGDNSFATTQMSAGDLVIEKFYPGLNACAPGGDYRLSVEMYEPRSGRVAALEDGAMVIALGGWGANDSFGNLYEHLDPHQSLDVEIAPQMRLFGYTLTPNNVNTNDEFSLSLFFRGAGDGKISRHISVRLQNTNLVERDVTLPPEGRGLCVLLDLRAPTSSAPGAQDLFVNDINIGTLSVK